MHSRKVAAIAVLVALSISTNYAMQPLSNVKLMDLIVFVGGFCFGPNVGVLIGVISWAVYGTLNPLGFILPVLLSTMFSEPIYGIVGAIIRKSVDKNASDEIKSKQVQTYLFFGILGMLMTFAYDIITNIVFGLVSGWDVIFAIVVGFVPLGIIHMVSNAFFFGFGCVPTINAIFKVMGGENSGNFNK